MLASASKEVQSRLGDARLPPEQGAAVKAHKITAQDTVIETADGHRLPGVPLAEAEMLNHLRSAQLSPGSQQPSPSPSPSPAPGEKQKPSGWRDGFLSPMRSRLGLSTGDTAGETTISMPPAFTDPLFPPLPVYGPATPLRRVQCAVFRVSSGILSMCFLSVIVMGAFVESIPYMLTKTGKALTGKNPDYDRPFFKEEERRKREREDDYREWKQRRKELRSRSGKDVELDSGGEGARLRLEAGGKDKLVCDIAYYAHRVGLECETFIVETEDGFLLEMQHIWDPDDPPYYPTDEEREQERQERRERGETDEDDPLPPPRTPLVQGLKRKNGKPGRRKYPVLLLHGLLQSAGAFCVNDEDSIAFYLAKSGYDVFLGNSRCGLTPRHSTLSYSDPRMWAWNIRQMGILDLPCFITHILHLTSFPNLALVSHSQGTTQTFVALARQQRPEIGRKISVFCALAPAVYAGSLIDKFYFKFMRIISPGMFRIVFGIHAFIPVMMTMQRWVPAKVYGSLGYRVFWFMFGWSDERWDKAIRSRFFQFAPVYVSAEAMRWWLGRECFAKHRCILSTHDDDDENPVSPPSGNAQGENSSSPPPPQAPGTHSSGPWFPPSFPKLALWIAGSDALVDGRRLLRRFDDGKEPHVDLVHAKVIDEYEHLDVIWAIDAKVKVAREVKGVIWRSIGEDVRKGVVKVHVDDDEEEEGEGEEKGVGGGKGKRKEMVREVGESCAASARVSIGVK